MDNIKKQETNTEVFGVISKDTFGLFGARDIQTNSSWSVNPYGDNYAVIPSNLIEDIVATRGFCDIELNEDGTEVISFVPKEIPKEISVNRQPTILERLVALETAMLEQIGVVTE